MAPTMAPAASVALPVSQARSTSRTARASASSRKTSLSQR